MQAKVLLFGSAALLALLGVIFGYEFWFCAAALHGDPGGCAVAVAGNLLREPIRLFAVALGVAGVLIALRMGRKE